MGETATAEDGRTAFLLWPCCKLDVSARKAVVGAAFPIYPMSTARRSARTAEGASSTKSALPSTTMTTDTSAFRPPQKAILAKEQLTAFQSSQTHQVIVSYIETVNAAVVGVKLTDPCPESPVRMHAPLSENHRENLQ